MSFEELQRALSDPSIGLSYTWAEKLWNAVQCGNESKLLDDLESAQYLEPDEIASLFGWPAEILPPEVSPLDLVFALRTLIHLNGFHTRATPSMTPSWEQIADSFSVGSTHFGTIVRAIDAGYVVSLADAVPAFLPTTDAIELPSEGRFCVTARESERHMVIVTRE